MKFTSDVNGKFNHLNALYILIRNEMACFVIAVCAFISNYVNVLFSGIFSL